MDIHPWDLTSRQGNHSAKGLFLPFPTAVFAGNRLIVVSLRPTKSSDLTSNLRVSMSLKKKRGGKYTFILNRNHSTKYKVHKLHKWSSSNKWSCVVSNPLLLKHTPYSLLIILIKSSSSSPPMCCLWSVSKCWWTTVWTDSPSLGMSFFYCLITCLTLRQHMCPALLTSAMIWCRKRGSRTVMVTFVLYLVLIKKCMKILKIDLDHF